MKNKKLLIISLLFPILFGSCAVVNYAKLAFEDFNTYFNVYYNANRIFNEAEKELLAQQKDIFTTKVLAPPGNIVNKFVQVIEKCSRILQFHSNSSLVDNALFMIGKAYYYQREYPSAIRKFSELLATFPKSDYALQAKLWIAKSYAQTIETDRALILLNDIYNEAKEVGHNNTMADALLETLKIYYKRNDHEKIITLGNEYVKISKNREVIAQVLMQVGYSYSRLDNLDRALESYGRVKRFTNDYYYRFKSQLEYAKILREKNQLDEAKKNLDELYSESLYDEYKDYTELEYAYLSLSKGDTVKALDYFIRLDTTYSTKETGGIAQFELAKYLENIKGNLDSAKYYYDRSLRAPTSDEIKKDASFKSSLISRYKNIWTQINNFEKQISVLRTFPVDSTYPVFEEIEIDSSMLNDSAYYASIQEYLEEKRIADSLYVEKLKRDTLTYQANLKTADSLEVNIARLRFDLATLFIIDYGKPDSAYFHLKYIVEKYPDRDFSERAIYALANYYEEKGEKEKADSLFLFIYNNFFDTDISRLVARKINLTPKILKKDLPDLEYNEAEILVEQKKYDEAIKKLYQIYDKYQNSDYAPKSLLLIGYIYENKLVLYDSAYSVYKHLRTKFPQTLYAQRVNPKLIAYESEMQRKEQEKQAPQVQPENENIIPEQQENFFENPFIIKEKIDEVLEEDPLLKEDPLKQDDTKQKPKEKENIQPPKRR